MVIFTVKKSGNKNENNNDSPSAVQSVGNHVQMTEDGVKVNTSDKLAEKKVVNNIEFTNIQLTEKNGETLLIATVKNIGNAKSEMFAVNVTLLDENGGEIKTIPGLIAPLDVGATSQFSASTTLDYVDAYDFRVTAK